MKYLVILLLSVMLVSCSDYQPFPRYSLETLYVVPDSLKTEHRTWITETIRASNQNLSAGDFEDVEDVVRQVERTARNLYAVQVIGLRKEIDDSYYHDLHLIKEDMTIKELQILDSLKNL